MPELVYDKLFTPDYDCIRSSVVVVVSCQMSLINSQKSMVFIGSGHCVVGKDFMIL
jgi:hypothetical protein